MLVAGTMATAPTALAQGPVDAKRPQAEALNEEGKALAKKKDYAAARDKFLQAYALFPVPNMMFNAARMDHLRGEYADAFRAYRMYLALPESERVKAADRKDAEAFSADCDRKICHLEVHGTRTFKVDTKPITEPFVVGVGTHVIAMDGPRGPKTSEVSCHGGAALLVAEYEPKAEVVPPAPHPKVFPPATPEPTERGSWLVPGVLAGVGVVGVGLGAGLGLVASGKKSDVIRAAGNPPCDAGGGGCAETESSYASGKSLAIVSVVSYAVGGAALIGAVVATLVEKPWAERRLRSVSVAPWISSGTGGLVLAGGF